ncbi:MAG: hypothetical protein ABH827_05650 [bacterium]
MPENLKKDVAEQENRNSPNLDLTMFLKEAIKTARLKLTDLYKIIKRTKTDSYRAKLCMKLYEQMEHIENLFNVFKEALNQQKNQPQQYTQQYTQQYENEMQRKYGEYPKPKRLIQIIKEGTKEQEEKRKPGITGPYSQIESF